MSPAAGARTEEDVVLRLLTALIREDAGGLRTRGRVRAGFLSLGPVRIPVRPGGPGDLLADRVAAHPWVRHGPPGRRRTARRAAAVVRALGPVLEGDAPSAGHDGVRALRREATAAVAAVGARRRPDVAGRLRSAPPSGWAGAARGEAEAARRDHPLHPLSAARVGLTVADLRRYAPEHLPVVRLEHVRLPRELVERRGRLPGWWPDGEEVAVPVHPGTPRADLEQALATIGAPPVRPEPWIEARPTLSLRTLAPVDDPATHVKVALPVRTLGRLNVRLLLRPGLVDGALLTGVLHDVIGAAGFAGRVEAADETTWVHAGHPLLAGLVRRWDAGATRPAASGPGPYLGPYPGPRVGPVAGTARGTAHATAHATAHGTARGTAGGTPDERIMPVAAMPGAGLPAAHLNAAIELLLDWSVTAWLRFGLVPESHGQNALVAAGPRGVRLLLRDHDSARLDLGVLAGGLGREPRHRTGLSSRVADRRLLTGDGRELANLWVTTVLHQCVAAVLLDVAARDGVPPRRLLDPVRERLSALADRHADSRDAAVLRAVIIEAGRLPVKCGLTAATLLPRHATRAADVNKYYAADGPTYL